MAWPQNALSDDETIVVAFRPHWKLLFIPFVWFTASVIAAAVVAVMWPDALPWVMLALIVPLVLFVVRPLVSWWWTRYVLTTERLITRTGLIAKEGIEIPLENITNVNFSQTVFERLLGAGDLLIESAGTTGQSKFVNIPRPDRFQTTLYRVREDRSRALTLGGRETPRPPTASDAIRSLAELRNEGLISEEEYERKRQELLDEM